MAHGEERGYAYFVALCFCTSRVFSGDLCMVTLMRAGSKLYMTLLVCLMSAASRVCSICVLLSSYSLAL